MGSAGEASMLRRRSTAPKPSCRSGRWRASMSTPPTNIVVTRKSVTSRAVDRSPASTSATPTHADRGQGAVEQAAAASGDPGLDGQHGVERAVDHRGELGVAAQHVGLAQGRAQVVAGGDALLGRGGVVGPGGLLDHLLLRDLRQEASYDEVGGDRGEREQEDRRPPGEAARPPTAARRRGRCVRPATRPSASAGRPPTCRRRCGRGPRRRPARRARRAAAPSRRRAGRRAAGPRRGRRSWPRRSWRPCR